MRKEINIGMRTGIEVMAGARQRVDAYVDVGHFLGEFTSRLGADPAAGSEIRGE
jgi:hypothetical protein